MDKTIYETLGRLRRNDDRRSMTERIQEDGWTVGSADANHANRGADAPDNDR